MTDNMRERIARLDPMASGVPARTTESSQHLLEEIMSNEVVVHSDTRKWLPAAAAALVVAGIAAAFALGGGGASQPLVLSAPNDDITQMCIQFSVEELGKMPVAFEGVVTEAEGEAIELDVTKWFKGGEADTVVLEAPSGMEALIGGIPFAEGDSYLITAYDGTVNYCGFSGPATAELRAAFAEAFAG